MSNIIIPIENLAEILFDNSEEIPNDIYITFMDLLKKYHENQDNEKEIRQFLKKINKPIRIKLQKYLPPKPLCVINCSCENICLITESCLNITRFLFIGLSVIAGVGTLIFCIASRGVGGGVHTSPPPKKIFFTNRSLL